MHAASSPDLRATRTRRTLRVPCWKPLLIKRAKCVEAMEAGCSEFRSPNLRVDGGMVVNELFMQFQADILRREVLRPVIQETTALGAAYAAGLAVKFFPGLEELRANWAVARTWKPSLDEASREQLYRQWKKAVVRSLDWADS